MLRNNNMAVITRMAKSSLKSNKRRSVTMIIAVLLSAFMLFSVLTVGSTYFKMQRIQNIRLSGAEFDAIMYGVTEEQQELCKKNADVQKSGIIAIAGYVEETPEDGTPNVGLIWADSVYWNEMMAPAREWVKGEYPRAENEVMATKEALKECGFEGLDVGDTFQMTYGTPDESRENTFRISGIWDGFGDKKVFYVSEAFYKHTGYEISDVASGRILLDFKQELMSEKNQEQFIESMNLSKQQRLFFTMDMGYSVQIFMGIMGIVLITCLCAYLLIYNIMYLSVAGNIRYYGLLQTIGMTERQIYYLVQEQMVWVGGIGILGGIVTGWCISFFIVPLVVRSLGIQSGKAGGIVISFHPAIFILTIFLAGFTIFIASRKPAKIAVRSSPIEVLGYRPKTGIKKSHKTGKGNLLWRLAREQIRKDKKKAGVTMLSLAAGMSVFLCMVTLFSSQGAREYNYNYMDLDMIIKNDTINKEEREKRTPIMDLNLLNKISEIKDVKEVHPVIYTEIMIPWEPGFSDIWMREFYDMWMSIPYEDDLEEYKEFPENFGSSLIGISEADFDFLNQTLENSIDKEAFLKGETCILYRNGLDFTAGDLTGKKVTCAEYKKAENKRTFKIAGLTDENYYTALLGFPPTLIVSDKAAAEFVTDPMIFKAGIFYDKSYEEETEMQILALLDESPYAKDFSYDSKIEFMKNVKKAQGNMMGVGMGIIGILAFIGISNYINTSVSSVQSRQVELSVMESVGMSGRQMKKMLILEGVLYAAGSWLLTLTIGLGVTYYLFQSMNYRGASFGIPVLPILGAMACTVLICIAVPVLVYRKMEQRASVVERIRGFE